MTCSAKAVKTPSTSMLATSSRGASKTNAKLAAIATAKKTAIVKPESENNVRTRFLQPHKNIAHRAELGRT
jgi:hypothetical protein